MFTIEDIQTIVKRFYVKDDKVFARNIDQEIVDEKAVLPIKAAYLIFNEAEIRYKADMQLLGAKYVSSREKYLEKMMERFSVNGEENDLGQNKLIRDLVESNGHYEEDITSDGLDQKFSIFIDPKKSYGLAYLRLKLREKGFDTEDLELSYDTSNLKIAGAAKLFIDFKKRLFIEKEEDSFEDTSFEYKFAYDELDKAIKKEKHDRIEYWSDFLKQWKKAKNTGDFGRIEFLKDIVATVIKDIEKRKEMKKTSGSEKNSEGSLATIRKEKTVVEKTEPKATKKEPLAENLPENVVETVVNSRSECREADIDYVMKQTADMRKGGDVKSLEQSNETVNSISIVEEKKEPQAKSKEKITNSLLLRFDEILCDLENNKRGCKDKKELEKVYFDTRIAIKVCIIDETSNFYLSLSDIEKEFASRLMMKASAILDDRMRCSHWENVHEEALKILGWPSNIEIVVTPAMALEDLGILIGNTKKRILDENEMTRMKKYYIICKSSWKEFNSQDKLKCVELLKETTNVLKDERGHSYWCGVLDTLSASDKIGDN